MKRKTRIGAVLLAAALLLATGCRSRSAVDALAMEAPGDGQALAGQAEAPAAAAPGSTGDDGLDALPLLGPVFPGLGGQVHSSACDPMIDPYSACL